ncbi:hypothetical protein D3C80_1316510 [compost metagenome]
MLDLVQPEDVIAGIGEGRSVDVLINERCSAARDVVHVVETEQLGLDQSSIGDTFGGLVRAVVLGQAAKLVVLECFVTHLLAITLEGTRMQYVVVFPHLRQGLFLAIGTHCSAGFPAQCIIVLGA